MTGWRFGPEIQQFLHGAAFIIFARRDIQRPTARERDNEQQNTE
jgi:hypothetical protein